MMKKFLLALTLIFPTMAFASGGNLDLMKAPVDLHDKASQMRGAKLFVNYCLGCHQLGYQRYERTFNDLGIPVELGKEFLIPSGDKVGALITNAMNSEDAARWFGAAPPDLTLESRLRGPDWIYTYLKTFYYDESRPFKVNNVVFPDVGMPHVLQPLQGKTKLVEENGHKTVVADGSGELSDDEYEQAIVDLVNFLVYVGEPSKVEDHKLGVKVLTFLFIFLIFVYMLKREFWRDVYSK